MFRTKHSAFFNRLLVTTFYGFPIVGEQEHVRQSWMSRVKHTILRLSQNATTLADALVREAGMLYHIRSFILVGPAPGQDLILKACSKNPLGR